MAQGVDVGIVLHGWIIVVVGQYESRERRRESKRAGACALPLLCLLPIQHSLRSFPDSIIATHFKHFLHRVGKTIGAFSANVTVLSGPPLTLYVILKVFTVCGATSPKAAL